MEITIMVQEILLHEDSLASQKHLLEPDYLTDYLQMKQYEVSGEDKKEIKNILEYMILGYGLHVIVSELGMQSTLSLAERTIRRRTLTYNIASNFITMPIMFAYSPITSDVNQLSEFFNKLAKAQDSKLSEFASEIGFDSVQLDSWISNAMKKMEISISENAELIDDLTGQVITTIKPCQD